ncbi:MAG TPA: 50S ribosomal protein L11 methyltransferase [Pseudomonadales bacterium]
MAWLQLSIAADRERVEAVGDLLEAHGAQAVTLTGAGEEALLEPSPGEEPLWDRVVVLALLPTEVDLKALRAALEPLWAEVRDVEIVADDDWQSRWRAHAVRACFGGRLWLMPRDEPFEAPAAPGGEAPVVLRLDPGLAFGSGSHPTTRLCLDGLAALPLEGRRVLDFGCGSGVLALAACRLGAECAVAVDHDPQALLATRDNATYNQIEADRLPVMTPEALARAPGARRGFDVVVANILANPLVELAPVLTSYLAPGGRLMLSGLLAEQARTIRDAYPAIDFAAPVQEAEWIRLDGVLR